jgi:hypothetical protein
VQADPRAAGIGKRLTGVLALSRLQWFTAGSIRRMYVQCRTHSSFEMVKKNEREEPSWGGSDIDPWGAPGPGKSY